MKKTLLTSILLITLFFIGYEGCKRIQDPDKGFKVTLDSLNKVNDSLLNLNAKADATIEEFRFADSILLYQVEHQKTKIVTVTKFIDSSKEVIDTYSEEQLITSFNKRYPADTITNPLPIAQPVLVSAAKDLVELDGTKKILDIQDSVIGLQENRIAAKDTIINVYAFKEQNYMKVIGNKDLEIKTWNTQYNMLQLQNKKLKLNSKLYKIASYVVIGSLGFLVLSK